MIRKFKGFKRFSSLFLLAAILLFSPTNLLADHHEDHDTASTKPFNAGEIIMHHVQDAHEIHFWHGATLPLPVILYTDQGLDIFSSGNFTDANHNVVPYTSPSTGNTYVMEHGHIYQTEADGVLEHGEDGAITNAAPLDFSITKNVAGMFLAIALMFFIFISVAKAYKRNKGKAPKGLQSLIEPLILFIRDEIAKPSIGDKYSKFMPFLLTIFFFIWISNMLGLIPFLGGMNITGNIAVTLVLALFTFIITTVNGTKDYWIHIFNTPGVPWWLKIPVPLMPLVEVIGVFSKPFVLMLRLFANITAGHIIILSFTCLIFIFNAANGPGVAFGVSIGTVAFSVFMNFLELLVAFLQAYVFTLLAALYFGQAVEEHHH